MEAQEQGCATPQKSAVQYCPRCCMRVRHVFVAINGHEAKLCTHCDNEAIGSLVVVTHPEVIPVMVAVLK